MLIPLILKGTRDLGYNVTPDLKQEVHCKMLFSKAMARTFVVFKRLCTDNVSNLLKAGTTTFHPLLELITVVLNRYPQRDIKLLERV